MAGGETVRTFIAVEIPDDVRGVVSGVMSELRRSCHGVRWVPPENLHLSLKFLGNLEPERLSVLRTAVEKALSGSRSFVINLSGVGAFPNLRRPRVFWIGVGGEKRDFERIYENIEDVLSAEGFPREERKFSPHLTLGRVKSPRELGEVASKVDKVSFPPQEIAVSEIVIMKSDLRPSGPIYTPLARYELT